MKPGRIAAWTIAAVAVPGLAACSGTSSGSSPAGSASSAAAGTSSPAQSQAGSQPASSRPAGQGQAAGPGRLTPPGAHLAFGGPATVGWVPPSQDTGAGAHHGIKLRITVVSIQKGTMADFRNVELNGNERKSTPYYVQLRVTALAMLGSTVAQLAASLLHGYFNKRSLVVAAGPDGAPFRIHGDRRLLAGGDGALHAARATAASQRAVAELLAHGETSITCQEIFESLPDHVEQEGTLLALRQWHDSSLRDLCFGELFSLRRTSATRILASAVRRRFGVPSPDIEALRNG